jgi:hypothetical protein
VRFSRFLPKTPHWSVPEKILSDFAQAEACATKNTVLGKNRQILQ